MRLDTDIYVEIEGYKLVLDTYQLRGGTEKKRKV